MRDRYRGKAKKQTVRQLARYRENGTATAANTTASVQWHRHLENETATAAIARPSLLLPRYRENDAATAAICGKYRRSCGGMHVVGSLVFREATKEIASNMNDGLRRYKLHRSLRTLIRKLLFQCSHGIVIENPAVNRPSHGPKTAEVAYFVKMCDIFSPWSAPTIILLGETEHGCYF